VNETENERDKTALRQLLAEIDAKYPTGWFVAIGNDRAIAASADFDDLLDEVRAQGRNPRETLVVEAGAERPEYVTIF
jgi:hypothetical protein